MTRIYTNLTFKWILTLLFSGVMASSSLSATEISEPSSTTGCIDEFSPVSNPGFETVLAELHLEESSAGKLYIATELVHRYAEMSFLCEAVYLHQLAKSHLEDDIDPDDFNYLLTFLVLSEEAIDYLEEAWEFILLHEEAPTWVIEPVLLSWAEAGNASALHKASSTAPTVYGQDLANALITLVQAQNGDSVALNELLTEVQLGIQPGALEEEAARVTMGLAIAMARDGRTEQSLHLLNLILDSAAENPFSHPSETIYFEALNALSKSGRPEVALARLSTVMHHGFFAQSALSTILIDYAMAGRVTEAWGMLSLLKEPTDHARSAGYILMEANSEIDMGAATDLYQKFTSNENPLSFFYGSSLVGFKARTGDMEGARQLVSEMPYHEARHAFLLAELDIQSRLESTQ